MPRSRMIKPEFWTDGKLARLSEGVRLFFIGLWTMSDDYGVVKGPALLLKSQIFPLSNDVTVEDVGARLKALVDADIIIPFDSGSEEYFYIKNFTKHQKVNHPSKQRNPEYKEPVADDIEPFN